MSNHLSIHSGFKNMHASDAFKQFKYNSFLTI